jgi:hypothetical protein
VHVHVHVHACTCMHVHAHVHMYMYMLMYAHARLAHGHGALDSHVEPPWMAHARINAITHAQAKNAHNESRNERTTRTELCTVVYKPTPTDPCTTSTRTACGDCGTYSSHGDAAAPSMHCVNRCAGRRRRRADDGPRNSATGHGHALGPPLAHTSVATLLPHVWSALERAEA